MPRLLSTAVIAPLRLVQAPADWHRRRIRQAAEMVWDLYPPLAILIVVLLIASGCATQKNVAVAGEGSEKSVQSAVQPAPTGVAYPLHLPVVGTAAGRATIYHGSDRLELINLSRTDWANARLWLNGRWSIALDNVKAGQLLRYDFISFLDAQGQHFPTDNRTIVVEFVELQIGDELTRVRFGLGA